MTSDPPSTRTMVSGQLSDAGFSLPTHEPWPEPGGVFDLQPEIVLIGTGRKQVFLQPELMMSFYRREVGFEVMSTHAACRTFNVLVSESRNAVAALLPVG